MLNLPKSTEFNRRVPKQKFYGNLNVTHAIKRAFTEQIKSVYWKNKIAPSTTNLAEGVQVNEIQVFEIKLNFPSLDEAVLKLIDKEIPYHILFILNYEEKYQLWIGYKEEAGGNTGFKVSGYYHTEWSENPEIEMPGLDMDKVYENFVRQIAGDRLSADNDESLQKSIEKERQKQILQKQIEKLAKAIRREKQFNRQIEMNAELKKLKKRQEEF